MGERMHMLDNAKGLLVVLVVLGHYLPQIPQWSDLATCVHELVFLFHMPLFVFLSGIFSKSVYRDGRLRAEKIVSLVVLAFGYQLALYAVDGETGPLATCLLTFSSAPWYLLSLACWYMSVPLLARVRPACALVVSLGLSLASGAAPLNDVLAFNRTIAFLPFFAAGYYCGAERLCRACRSRAATAVAVLAAVFVVGWFVAGLGGSNPFFSFKYVLHVDPYRDGALAGACERLLGFACAALVSVGAMRAMPSRRTALAVLGERSMQVYVLHRIVRPLLAGAGAFDLPLFADPVGAVLVMAAASAAISAVLSWRPLGVPFSRVMHARWGRVLRA